jgi:hypothetical protein
MSPWLMKLLAQVLQKCYISLRNQSSFEAQEHLQWAVKYLRYLWPIKVFVEMQQWTHRHKEISEFVDQNLYVELTYTVTVIHRAASDLLDMIDKCKVLALSQRKLTSNSEATRMVTYVMDRVTVIRSSRMPWWLQRGSLFTTNSKSILE